MNVMFMFFFFFSSRRRHTRSYGDWSSDVCLPICPCGGAGTGGSGAVPLPPSMGRASGPRPREPQPAGPCALVAARMRTLAGELQDAVVLLTPRTPLSERPVVWCAPGAGRPGYV